MTDLRDTTSSFALQVFSCSRFGDIRIVMRDNEPWFVAKDVAACIDHKDVSTMCRMCRDKDLYVASASGFDSAVLTESGNSRITLVSESGLYRILARSNLPKCEPFENWVFDEVLPSIRKNGAYFSPDAVQSVVMQVTNTVLQTISNHLVSQITGSFLSDKMIPVVADCVLQKVGDRVIDAVGKGIERKFSRNASSLVGF